MILVILRRKSGNSNPVFIGADISTSQYERSRTTTEEAISVFLSFCSLLLTAVIGKCFLIDNSLIPQFLHELQEFFVIVRGICKIYLVVFVCLKDIGEITPACRINSKRIQKGSLSSLVAAVGIPQHRDLIGSITISVCILFFESYQNVIQLVQSSRNLQTQVFQPGPFDKGSHQTVCHIASNLSHAINMAILSRQERLQLRILFKGSYHVRHDITILIEVQKISLRTVRIDITDRKSGVHNQIRQFISCKQKFSGLASPSL